MNSGHAFCISELSNLFFVLSAVRSALLLALLLSFNAINDTPS